MVLGVIALKVMLYFIEEIFLVNSKKCCGISKGKIKQKQKQTNSIGLLVL